MTQKTRIYFAAPLFTQAEWLWNKQLAGELTKLGLDIILPQDRAEPMLSGNEDFNPEVLFNENIKGIEQSNIILAVFDQADPDSGTCWECGYAYKLGHPIIGLKTDIRGLGDTPEDPVNLMLSRSCNKFIKLPYARRDDLLGIAKEIVQEVKYLISQT